MPSIDTILSRLDRVTKQGGGWIARCPAHDDHTPSLSLYEHQDGRILLHCFAGCPASDVLAAIGLSLSDLYPEPLTNRLPIPAHYAGGDKRVREVAAQRRVDSQAGPERTVLAICRAKRDRGERLTSADLHREREAYQRLKSLGLDWRAA
jgi:predicted protein tyrosine phosphatase